MRKESLRLAFCLATLVSFVPAASGSEPDLKGYTSNLPFVMPAIGLPIFPSRVMNIKDFGAVGDGHTVNTVAFGKAIAACSQAGGGRVLVPPGIWLTGPIELASKIDLHLERGAVIVFTGRFEDYPLVRTSFEGADLVRCTSPISAVKAEDIAITGEGIIDGAVKWTGLREGCPEDRKISRRPAGGGEGAVGAVSLTEPLTSLRDSQSEPRVASHTLRARLCKTGDPVIFRLPLLLARTSDTGSAR